MEEFTRCIGVWNRSQVRVISGYKSFHITSISRNSQSESESSKLWYGSNTYVIIIMIITNKKAAMLNTTTGYAAGVPWDNPKQKVGQLTLIQP